ncbi:unnamed protein product, partial [marine sediment metagenome]
WSDDLPHIMVFVTVNDAAWPHIVFALNEIDSLSTKVQLTIVGLEPE